VPVTELVETTTAWGQGAPLDATLEAIAVGAPNCTTVEISIGSRPVANPQQLFESFDSRFTFVAHHTAPITPGGFVRPDLHADPRSAARALSELNISSYSGHPPTRRHCDDATFWAWALRWWETLAAFSISWSVETMYTPRTRDETSRGGYHLDTPDGVWSFCERAVSVGWDSPLLVDASHLHIGFRGGQWSEADVVEVIAHAPASELHLSTNDGRRDTHDPLTTSDVVHAWCLPHLGRYDLVVDEGRRLGVNSHTTT
jgi:sugar phosphate isomerase/epimerase